MDAKIVHTSQTRRKACEGCVKGKRRCDLILPRCGRCLKKDIDCEYVTGPYKGNAEALQPALSPNSSTTSGPVAVSDASRDVDTPSQLPVVCEDIPINSFLLSYENFGEDSLPLLDIDISQFHFPSRVVPSPLHFNYLTKFLRHTIVTLALQSQTFFIHRSFLVNHPIPPPLQSALSVCALASLNSPSTFAILDFHLETLITSSSTTFYSSRAILHSVQAFILFQAVRLFSCNQEQIFHAEIDFPRLNTWTIALQTAYFSCPSCHTSYEDWILKESIRRTILTSVLLRSLYCTTKDGYSELIPLLASLPVSFDGRLWETDREELGDDEVAEEEIGTYWEFLVARAKDSEEDVEKGSFEKVLLCLEEDGGVGEAARELVNQIKAGGN